MRHLPSRLRRLDDALAALPVDEPMLLSELDGFLTGILLAAEPIPSGEWLPLIWESDAFGEPPFEDQEDMRWFVDAITARATEIARALARDKPQPLFDVEDRTGNVLWEPWIDGFAYAATLRPDDWVADARDGPAAAALSRLALLIAVAREESTLDSIEINALSDRAPDEIVADIGVLHRWRTRGAPITANQSPTSKPGRNDPCPCGSGKKHKRCCG